MEKSQVKLNVPYFQVPNDIFDLDIKVKDPVTGEKRELRTSEKLVYIYLCRCGNQGNNAFPSYTRIGEKCGISRRKAIDAVKLLFDNGLLIKQVRPKDNKDNETNIYEVITPSAMVAPGPSAMTAPPSAMVAPKKEILYKELISEKEIMNNGLLSADEKTMLYGQQEANYCINYYFDMYAQRMGKQHRRLRSDQYTKIRDKLREFINENNLDENHIEAMVNRHFNRNLDTDYNINHFATDGILLNLYYEAVYRAVSIK